MPLALLALFVGYLLINAGIRNQHPWAEIVTAFGGAPPGPPGISPGEADSISPPGQGRNTTPSELGSQVSSKATRSIKRCIAFATHLPGVHVNVGTICGPGSVAGSQHPMCNAVDLTAGSRKQLLALFHASIVAAKTGAIPCAEVIGPGGPSDSKGLIATAAGGWRLHEYTGPNSHQTHVHLSGSPLL